MLFWLENLRWNFHWFLHAISCYVLMNPNMIDHNRNSDCLSHFICAVSTEYGEPLVRRCLCMLQMHNHANHVHVTSQPWERGHFLPFSSSTYLFHGGRLRGMRVWTGKKKATSNFTCRTEFSILKVAWNEREFHATIMRSICSTEYRIQAARA